MTTRTNMNSRKVKSGLLVWSAITMFATNARIAEARSFAKRMSTIANLVRRGRASTATIAKSRAEKACGSVMLKIVTTMFA